MPRNARLVIPELAYHVTQRGSNRDPVFFSASDRTTYLSLLAQNLAETETRLLAWCLMTNHVHLVLIPGRDDSMAVLTRRVHGRYAQMVNTKKGRTGHLWQNRYFSCPLSESHLRRTLAYVELNPVRAGIVSRPEDYKWSSAPIHMGLTPDRLHLADMDFWQQEGGAESWRSLLMTPEEVNTMRLLRRCTYSGRPFGEDDFMKSFEDRFQRKWRRWAFEKQLATSA